MKKLSLLLLISLAVGCKKQEADLLPQQARILVGEWELTAREITLDNGVKEWESLDSLPGKRGFFFRSDGVFLGMSKISFCCGPAGKFAVNGETFYPKFQRGESCASVLCAPISCLDHQLQINKDEMIWTSCENRTRYRRLP